MKNYCFIFILFITQWCFAQLPEGFVYAKSIIPDLVEELRYCTENNFVGEAIDGYEKPVIIMTLQTAHALKKVQEDLKKEGLGIKVFDAYRPQQAVNHFVRWAKVEHDTVMKQTYYPDVKKRNLIPAGYIASKSRHSSGSTLDVTIINLSTGEELDMGSPYDFFGQKSWVKAPHLDKEHRKNRDVLQKVMAKHGFRNYMQEWWHFTLRGEPFKNKYFDFIVR
ncbi:M15 family metallopeptidase [Aurantibacter aestuarii]|uniref:D-alanyl-D-alanine dipeptidase n=1 Tax=Aurantibacter aestuarii TaxID=1266046 RepID=A0A2T1N4T1_9FLAO|nr:M15 family metallopeptidase [Aurantibacter aestuarii]PSG86281.1 peptidase M15 [Aurantibacter aestuarii]